MSPQTAARGNVARDVLMGIGMDMLGNGRTRMQIGGDIFEAVDWIDLGRRIQRAADEASLFDGSPEVSSTVSEVPYCDTPLDQGGDE